MQWNVLNAIKYNECNVINSIQFNKCKAMYECNAM